MNVNEAKVYIDEALNVWIPKLESAGLTVDKHIDIDENETPEGTEVIGVLGVLNLYCGNERDDKVIFLPLSAEVSEGTVNEAALVSSRELLDTEAARILEDMANAEDKAHEFARLMKEIDDKEEAEYRERIRLLNEGTKRSLKTAIIATAALLCVAAICFVIKALT